MAIFGGFRSPRYGRGGYSRYGGYRRQPVGNSCVRDLLMLEAGCCLAELIGCGPQLLLVSPSLARRSGALAKPLRGWRREEVRHWLLCFLTDAIRHYQTEVSAKRRRPCCRYSPSCSHYALQALAEHGLRRGGWLVVRRLARCRPGSAGGSDPVPAARNEWAG